MYIYILGIILPTDFKSIIFRRGGEQPPTSHEKMMLPDLDPQVLPAMSDSHVFCDSPRRQAGDKKGEVSALHTAGRPGEVLGSLGAKNRIRGEQAINPTGVYPRKKTSGKLTVSELENHTL